MNRLLVAVKDGRLPPRAVARACFEVVCRDDVREAWEAIRPHDIRRAHALRVVHDVLRGEARYEEGALLDLDNMIGAAADDIRRWERGERFVRERGVAALLAARYALRVTVSALRRSDRLALSVAACARYVAEAAIEPREAVCDDILARAERREESGLLKEDSGPPSPAARDHSCAAGGESPPGGRGRR